VFVCYFAIMVHALPRASRLPQPIFGLCAVFNFATIVSIDFGIRSVPLQITATCPTSENDSQENRRAKADLSAERGIASFPQDGRLQNLLGPW